MFLVVGLGNPGSEYIKTRHNAGFIAADFISSRYNFVWSHKAKFKADMAQGEYESHKMLLCKPDTFMNLSGRSIAPICSFYKLKPEQVIVIHDDVDVPVGRVKYKIGGSAAGHNGLKSIDSNIGSGYHRIRIGVGRPEDDRYDISDFVLGKFTKKEEDEIAHVLHGVIDILPFLFSGDLEEFKKGVSNIT